MSYAINLVLQGSKIVSEDFPSFVSQVDEWLPNADDLPPESEYTVAHVMIQTRFGEPELYIGVTSFPFRMKGNQGWIDRELASMRQFHAGQGDSWHDLTPEQARVVADYLQRLNPEAWRRSPEVRIPLAGTQFPAA